VALGFHGMLERPARLDRGIGRRKARMRVRPHGVRREAPRARLSGSRGTLNAALGESRTQRDPAPVPDHDDVDRLGGPVIL